MKYRIPQLIPYVGKEEVENLKKVIDTKWLTEGAFSEKFVNLIKDFTGAKHVLLANNGTLGLFLSLLSLGVGPGDEVIVPDFTFIASASSVVFTGAKPVFVDVKKEDLNIDPDQIESKITSRTKAIMPVHIYGQAADMEPILKIAKKYNLKVIEDAAQGFGVYYKGRHTGTIGDIGVISFFADKTITMGEGAVVLTNDDKIFEKARLIRNQGRPSSGTFIHPALGMNFRVTDLQCAVGVAQIRKFDEIKKLKIAHYQLYKRELSSVKQIKFLQEMEYSNFVPFRANILVQRKKELINYLERHGIQTREFFYPLHRQPCFSYLKYKKDEFPVSNFAFAHGLSLPVFCDLRDEEILYICSKIKEFYGN
jgi:perosamine synthetase